MQSGIVQDDPVACNDLTHARTCGRNIHVCGTIAVDRLMLQICERPAHNTPLVDALEHHLAGGGGRTRARLALSAADALGLRDQDALHLAAAVELLHNASLVQDDMQDVEPARRGQDSVWRRYGRNTAIGLTDLMISAAYCALAELSCVRVLPALNRRLHAAIGETLHGQTMDLERHHQSANLEGSLLVARSKSGPLFALALELPLIAAQLDGYADEAHRAACAFGTGYQLADDVLDVESDRKAGVGTNIVLVLQRTCEADEAVSQTRRLACQYLQIAARIGSTLPRCSGKMLSALAHRMIRQLEEHHRD